MQWGFRFNLDISRGRKVYFSLQWIPFFRRLHQRHKKQFIGCFGKTRFPNEKSALNAEWFKKHPKPFRVYKCPVCDGWHITTQVGEKDGNSKNEMQ